VDPAALQLSQRILLHLQRLGAFGVTEVAPVGATQIGMTEALGVRQSSLTKVLTRLVAAGALTESKGHVEGAPRRLKIYRLTPLGESVARDLRRRASTGRVAPSREPWGPSAR
jgi:DNA-binding MarR family transcriptional regulator